MPSETHIARVTATFEFYGIVSKEFSEIDPVKKVESAFKFFNPEIPGFVCESRKLEVKTKEVQLPEL